MKSRKGIVLAGGAGTRLYPVTQMLSKSLLPIYNKPMIYYPLSILMLTGIRDIAIITNPEDQHIFKRALGDGSQWGISLTYIKQESPDGLAQAYILTEEFLAGAPSVMILGDNLFFGHSLPNYLKAINTSNDCATILGYQVADPERFGVVETDADDRILSIVEKPKEFISNWAITGLYFLDGTAPERSKQITPSERGELEIISLLNSYLDEGKLKLERLGRGIAWLDTGTHASLLDAGNFVKTVEMSQGLHIGNLDEIAFDLGWIDETVLRERAKMFNKSDYGKYLERLASNSS